MSSTSSGGVQGGSPYARGARLFGLTSSLVPAQVLEVKLYNMSLVEAFTILCLENWMPEDLQNLETYLYHQTQLRNMEIDTNENLSFARDVLIASDAIRRFDALRFNVHNVPTLWHLFAIIRFAHAIESGEDLMCFYEEKYSKVMKKERKRLRRVKRRYLDGTMIGSYSTNELPIEGKATDDDSDRRGEVEEDDAETTVDEVEHDNNLVIGPDTEDEVLELSEELHEDDNDSEMTMAEATPSEFDPEHDDDSLQEARPGTQSVGEPLVCRLTMVRLLRFKLYAQESAAKSACKVAPSAKIFALLKAKKLEVARAVQQHVACLTPGRPKPSKMETRSWTAISPKAQAEVIASRDFSNISGYPQYFNILCKMPASQILPLRAGKPDPFVYPTATAGLLWDHPSMTDKRRAQAIAGYLDLYEYAGVPFWREWLAVAPPLTDWNTLGPRLQAERFASHNFAGIRDLPDYIEMYIEMDVYRTFFPICVLDASRQDPSTGEDWKHLSSQEQASVLGNLRFGYRNEPHFLHWLEEFPWAYLDFPWPDPGNLRFENYRNPPYFLRWLEEVPWAYLDFPWPDQGSRESPATINTTQHWDTLSPRQQAEIIASNDYSKVRDFPEYLNKFRYAWIPVNRVLPKRVMDAPRDNSFDGKDWKQHNFNQQALAIATLTIDQYWNPPCFSLWLEMVESGEEIAASTKIKTRPRHQSWETLSPRQQAQKVLSLDLADIKDCPEYLNKLAGWSPGIMEGKRLADSVDLDDESLAEDRYHRSWVDMDWLSQAEAVANLELDGFHDLPDYLYFLERRPADEMPSTVMPVKRVHSASSFNSIRSDEDGVGARSTRSCKRQRRAEESSISSDDWDPSRALESLRDLFVIKNVKNAD
ncbi:hypothetical protein BJ170DRAFT_730019 [Xylariales sp. AK1849]|nr:hypothetical protein BJ170DRAFT_730019 [Xylariales sp. AK1849]